MHIYKQKGAPEDCASYRPIFITQIIYKIWSQLIAQKLAKILHLIANKTQYGYKERISTIDAIIKLEDQLQKSTKQSHIVLMDLTKAFGAINRTILRTALYKKVYRRN